MVRQLELCSTPLYRADSQDQYPEGTQYLLAGASLLCNVSGVVNGLIELLTEKSCERLELRD